jgi:hypothetical protein
MKRLKGKMSYANVMATAAVFLALGGAAYAAIKVPKNSVGTAQLKAHAVTAKKLAAQSVGEGALTTSLQAQLARTAQPGAQGPMGLSGSPGPKGPASVRLQFSEDGTGASGAHPIATVGPLTLMASCETNVAKTSLSLELISTEAGVMQEDFTKDEGTDPHSIGPSSESSVRQVDVPAGKSILEQSSSVNSGEYFRTIAHIIFITQKQTDSIDFASLDGEPATHCSVSGVAISAE